MSEAFVYLWFDSKNRKFYLGKHKGTPDDGYTHSSTVMESFDVPPPHMKRRILAYGTDEEMCLLEHECLKNRKEKKWERYYNKHLGDPRYIDQSGENNPSYKHGLANDPEWKKRINRKYYHKNKKEIRQKENEKRRSLVGKEREEYLAKKRDEYQRHKNVYRAKSKKRYEEKKEEIIAYQKEYWSRPENKERRKKTDAEWREKNREKIRKQQRKHYYKKKAEKLAQQTGATLPL